MAFVPPHDRVLERSTSNSQTVFALTGAADPSYNAFSASMSVGDTTIGGVIERGVAFVSGVLTYSASNQVTVTGTPFESKGAFSAGGTKEVFMGLPGQLGAARKPIIIYADGQSNISLTPALAWSPNSNVKIWNNSVDAINTGTAFVALSATTVGIAEKFASDIADANPSCLVYLIKNAYTGKSISHWLSGTGAPDLYANGTANLAASLAAIGATKIDWYLRWQGEADLGSATYGADYETMMARYWGNSYFPRETPCIICGIESTADRGDPAYDKMNDVLAGVVSNDPGKRRMLYTSDLAGATYWDVSIPAHMTGLGYFSAGALAAHTALNGPGRNPQRNFVVSDAGNFATLKAFGAGVSISGYRSDGTLTARTGLLDGDLIVTHGAKGFDGTADVLSDVAGLEIYARGNWTTGNHGTNAWLRLTPAGSNSSGLYHRWDPGSYTIGGATSGGIVLTVPASGSSGTLTLPSATDTLVGQATTDTLSNKTLVAPALGTPASGVVTNLTGTASININGTVGATTPNIIKGTTISPTVAAGTGWGIDFSSAPQLSVTGSSSAALATGSGLVMLTDTTSTGQTGLYLIGGSLTASAVLIAGGSAYVAPTITPAANKYSVGFDGTNWKVYNGNTSTIAFNVGLIRARNTD